MYKTSESKMYKITVLCPLCPIISVKLSGVHPLFYICGINIKDFGSVYEDKKESWSCHRKRMTRMQELI